MAVIREFYQVGTTKDKDGNDTVDLEKLNFALRRAFTLIYGADESGSNHGSMYCNDVTTSVTISAIDTYYLVDEGFGNGPVSSTAFTLDDYKRLKCTAAGIYLVQYSVSLQCGTTAQDVSACIQKNGGDQDASVSHAYIDTVDKNIALSSQCILSLGVNDNIQLAVANHTATNNLVVTYASVTAYSSAAFSGTPAV